MKKGPIYICFSLILGCFFSLSAQSRQSRDFEKMAENLFSNVVIVESGNIECKGLEETQDGFGLIIGETKSKVYIATAYHLVCGMNAKIRVQFKWASNFHNAKLIANDSNRDMAILSVDIPEGLEYKRKCLMRREVQFNDPVKIIGVDGRRVKQTDDEGGYVVDHEQWVDSDFIQTTISLRKRSAGGPGYTPSGVFGIASQSGTNSRFIDIREFQKLAQRKGIPFELTEYRRGSKRKR